MLLQGSFLLCTVLALSSALPHHKWHWSRADHQWHTDPVAKAQDQHHAVMAVDNVGKNICRSAVGQLSNIRRTFHVCQQESREPQSEQTQLRACFYTTAPCCLGIPGLVLSRQTINVEGLAEPVTVTFETTGDKTDLCYKTSSQIDSCLPEACVPSCTGPDPICADNTITGNNDVCENQVCECKPEYRPPDCCACADGFTMIEGRCEKICVENCARRDEIAGCLQCRRGYAPLPHCCNCTEFFYVGADETCTETKCPQNVDSCEDDSCTCKPGYGPPPDCCYCRDNIVPESCDENGVCQCRVGFIGDDCCTGTVDPICDDNVVPGSCDGKTCRCKDGFGPEPNCCFCKNNIDLTTCNEDGTECACKENFRGNDCCDEVPQCTGRQDIFFLIDATNSNPQYTFCHQMFALELITAALNPKVGNDLSGTRIGTYLYPKNEFTAKNLLTYFPVGSDNCGDSVTELHRLMRAYVTDEADFTPAEADLKKLREERLRGSITLPAKGIELLTDVIRNEVAQEADRKRVVIILTDGAPNPAESNLAQQEIANLVRAGGKSLTLIAAGVANQLTTKYNNFVAHVRMLANGSEANSYVTERNARNPGIQLGRRLVTIMEENGAICKNQSDAILSQLNLNGVLQYYCDCNINLPFFGDFECSRSCPNNIYKNGAGRAQCLAPPTDECTTFLDLAAPSAQKQGANEDLEALEKEIIAAVESVLENKGLITE